MDISGGGVRRAAPTNTDIHNLHVDRPIGLGIDQWKYLTHMS